MAKTVARPPVVPQAEWETALAAAIAKREDGIPQLGLLHSRDITFAMVSPAPQENLRGYAERMGWTDITWYWSSPASTDAQAERIAELVEAAEEDLVAFYSEGQISPDRYASLRRFRKKA